MNMIVLDLDCIFVPGQMKAMGLEELQGKLLQFQRQPCPCTIDCCPAKTKGSNTS